MGSFKFLVFSGDHLSPALSPADGGGEGEDGNEKFYVLSFRFL
jgi:hypothetical protein